VSKAAKKTVKKAAKKTAKKTATKASKDDAKRFMEAVEKDAKLRAKVKGTLDQIQKLAKAEGYSFSHDELRKHLRQRWNIKTAPKYDSSSDTCFFA
jgi:predicted ribosomally synthesized peptide with nif11-like leader